MAKTPSDSHARLKFSQARVLQQEKLIALLRYLSVLIIVGLFVNANNPQVLIPSGLLVLGALGSLFLILVTTIRLWVGGSLATTRIAVLADVGLMVFWLLVSGAGYSPLWTWVYLPLIGIVWHYPMGVALATAFFFAALHLGLSLWSDAKLFAVAVDSFGYGLFALVGGFLVRLGRAQAEANIEHTQAIRQDAEAFTDLTNTISSTGNYKVALEQTLDLSLRGLRGRGRSESVMAGIALLFKPEDTETLWVAAHRNLEGADQTRDVKPTAGAIQQVLMVPDPLIVKNAASDPLLGQFNVAKRMPLMALLPLRVGYTMFGVIVICMPSEAEEVITNRLESQMAYARQAAIAVQNATLYAQLRAEHDRIVDSEEKVRHELARDLHDGPVNAVASITMQLDFLKHLVDQDPAAAKIEIESMHKLAAKTAREMRTAMYRLRPLALENAGLVAAFEQYFKRLQEEHPTIKFVLNAPPPDQFEPRLNSNQGVLVFDIAKECVSNSIKHAQAKTISVTMKVNGNLLLTTIADDGKGFDVKKVMSSYETRGSLGMVNIRERAELAGGDAQVDSAPGKGTRTTVRVTLNPMGRR